MQSSFQIFFFSQLKLSILIQYGMNQRKSHFFQSLLASYASNIQNCVNLLPKREPYLLKSISQESFQYQSSTHPNNSRDFSKKSSFQNQSPTSLSRPWEFLFSQKKKKKVFVKITFLNHASFKESSKSKKKKQKSQCCAHAMHILQKCPQNLKNQFQTPSTCHARWYETILKWN